MSTKKRRFFSGSTLEQAVISAASEYELAPAEVAYRKVEKRHGFLRAQRRVIIEVDPANPRLDKPGASPPPLPVRRPVDAGFTKISRRGGEEAEDSDAAEEPAVSKPTAPAREERARAPRPERAERAPRSRERSDGGEREAPARAPAAASEGEDRGGRPARGADRGGEGGSKQGGDRGPRGARPPREARSPGEARGPRTGGAPREEQVGEERGRGGRPPRRNDEREVPRRPERPSAPAPRPEEREEKPVRAAEPPRRKTEEPEMDLMEAAETAVDRLLALTDLDVDFDIEIDGDRIEVDLGGPERDVLLEEQGRALFSIELLVPILIRGLNGQRVFCHVDAGGYRAEREEELRELALEMAEQVAASGEEKTLDWLNPAERRVVHMALADHESVETESEGRGYLKRLTIWPL